MIFNFSSVRKKTEQFVLIGSLIVCSNMVFAQQDLPPEKVENLLKVAAQFEGKYQIQIKSREKPAIQLIVFEKMQKLQSNTDTVYISLKPNIRIMLPPKSVTEAKNFILMEKTKYMPY